MKTTRSFVRSAIFLAFAFLFGLGGSRLLAETTSNAVGAAPVSPVPARITQAIDDTQLTALKGSVHPLARAEFDRGAVPDATPMNRMLLFLQRSPQQEAALQQLMADQMSKASPNFHNWLTPAQFGAQFGPADADIQTVTNWLSSQGFHDIKVGTGKLTIEFSGNVGLVRHAFHTDIHHFFVNGEMRQANVSAPQIPSALTPVVAGIVSLHNFPKKSMIHKAGAYNGTRDSQGIPQLTGPANCGTAGQPACFYALGPADFAAIYDIPTSTLNGLGSKIAIIGTSDIDPNDVTAFRALFGLMPANNVVVVHNGPAPGNSGPNGEEGEADLDVEWSGAVAPQAEIDFIVTEDTLTSGGIEMGALYVVDNNTDDIMSLSFGECEAGLGAENAFLNALWEQAAAQGISVTVSSGDPGAAGCDDFNAASVATQGLAVNGLASTPFNIAVGGTDFDDVGKQTMFWNSTNAANTRQSVIGYIPETTWNDSCAAAATSANLATVCAGSNATNIVGGGGGFSTVYTKPSWQRGTGVPADKARDLPDVSLFASNGPQSQSFYVVCEADAVASNSCSSTGSFSFLGVGGTSASAPSFAGILALIEQAERTRVPGSNGRQGNANLVLYNIFNFPTPPGPSSCSSSSRTTPATPPPAGCVFNDVTVGNNSVPCAGAPAPNTKNCSSTTTGTNGVLVEPSATTTPAWTTTAGYDLATGLGSVNVANLATAWASGLATTNSTTALTVNGSTTPAAIPHGASVTLAATVAPQAGSGTPSGDVAFVAPTSVNGGVGNATLSGGNASLATTFLPGGTYNLTAHYAGDGTFAPSDSAGISVTVNKENSRLQYSIVTFDPVTGNIANTNATSVVYGSPYVLRMDILNSTANACQPLVTGGITTGCAVDATGTVTITDNGSPLDTGNFVINSQGHAEDQPIQLSGGVNALSATYSGDISYNAVTTPVLDSVTVTPATTTTTLSANPASAQVNQQVALSVAIATQSNSAQGPTGNVTFKDGSATLGTVAATPTGATATAGASATATFNASFTTGGAHSITAVYAGDTNYSTSTSTAISVNVTPIGITATPVTVAAGSSGNSTVTVTPSGGFTGNVAITCAALPGVTCGALSINVTGASPVSGTLSVSVAANSPSTMAMALPSPREMWATTLPPRSGVDRGWWALTAFTGLAAVLLLLLPGRKRYRAAFVALSAACLVSFALGCGGGYGGGGGGGGGGLTPTTTTVSVTSTKVAQGTNIAFNVNVASTGRAPVGQVQLFSGSTAIGPATTVSSGTASISVSTLPVGVTGISAHYMGDAYTAASQSGTLNIAITGTTQLAITGTSGTTTASTNASLTIN